MSALVNPYLSRIRIQAGVRSGKPCIRHTRITVQEVLRWLASGATEEQILNDYPIWKGMISGPSLRMQPSFQTPVYRDRRRLFSSSCQIRAAGMVTKLSVTCSPDSLQRKSCLLSGLTT